jgi:UDP-glucose 4-epimerase
MANCLVIGGGLLGGATAQTLAEAGHEVVVFSRSYGASLDPVIGRKPAIPIRYVAGTIGADPGVTELVDAADAVFYFAGGSTPAAGEAGGSVGLSVLPATTVLETMRATGTTRLVIASSGGTVYGDAGVFPTPEDHPTEPTTLHAYNSLTVEGYVRFFAEHYGLEPIVLRIATGYGPGQRVRRGQGVISAWINAALDERPLAVYGSRETRRDFVYSLDVGEAAARTAFDADPGTYNVGSGQSVSLDEVIGLLGTLAGRELELIEQPARGVDLPRTELDCSRLLDAVGWAPSTPLADGLRSTWEWTAALREAARETNPASGAQPRAHR